MKPGIVLTSLSLVISGCMLGPDYERPEVELPERFEQSDMAGESIANVDWWSVFEDPNLSDLINLALVENKDLAIAVSRIEEAPFCFSSLRLAHFSTRRGLEEATDRLSWGRPHRLCWAFRSS